MFSTKVFILLACSLAITVATPVNNGEKTDVTVQLSGEQIEVVQQELQRSLNYLAVRDGPHYEISNIVSASVQESNTGNVVKMNVNLVDADGTIRNCNVAIMSNPWLVSATPYSSETTIDCAGQKTLVESHKLYFLI